MLSNVLLLLASLVDPLGATNSSTAGDAAVTLSASAPIPLASIRSRSFGATWDGGRCFATGPGYLAEIGAEGVEFRSHGEQLALRLLSVEHGGNTAELWQAPGGLAAHPENPNLCHRRWSSRLWERYEATASGLEHTFLFEERPLGDGDLVVRLELESGLSARLEDGVVRFSDGSRDILCVGGVTGIDARGQRAAGELRLVDGELHYVLPDAFLDRAAWPVLLDPLIGGTTLLDGGLFDSVSVAHSGTSNQYLVAWIDFTNVDLELGPKGNLVAQRVSASGSLVGSQIALDTTGRANGRAQVGWSRLNNRYLVVWGQLDLADQRDLLARTVAATNGALSSGGALTFTTALNERPLALSNETSTVDDELLLLYDNGSGSSTVRQVTVPTSGVPAFTGAATVPGVNFGTNEPLHALSTQGGSLGLFGLLRLSIDGFFSGYSARLRVLDRNGLSFAPEVTFPGSFGSTSTYTLPALDGDGKHFVCVWRVDDRSLALSTYRWEAGATPGTGSLVEIRSGYLMAVVPTGTTIETPSVAYGPEGTWVAWTEKTGSVFTTRVQLVDTVLGSLVGAPIQVPGRLVGRRSIASQAQGRLPGEVADSNTIDEAALLLEAPCTGSGCLPDLVLQRITASGKRLLLGGGCAVDGPGGAAYATGMTPGGVVRLSLYSTAKNSPTFALLGAQGPSLTCGPCALRVDLNGILAIPRTIDAKGDASLELSVPNTPSAIGISLAVQWLTPAVSPGCDVLSSNLSDALLVTVE